MSKIVTPTALAHLRYACVCLDDEHGLNNSNGSAAQAHLQTLEEECKSAYGLLRGQHQALTCPMDELHFASYSENEACPPGFVHYQLSADSVCYMRDKDHRGPQLSLPDGIHPASGPTHSHVEAGIMCNAGQIIEAERAALSGLVDGVLWRLQAAQEEGLALSQQCRELERKLHDRDHAWANHCRQLKAELAAFVQAPGHLISLALPEVPRSFKDSSTGALDACSAQLDTGTVQLREAASPTDSKSQLVPGQVNQDESVLEGRECADAQRRFQATQPYVQPLFRDTYHVLGGLERLEPFATAEFAQPQSKWDNVPTFPESGLWRSSLCPPLSPEGDSEGCVVESSACLKGRVTCSPPAEMRDQQVEAALLLHARAQCNELECQVQQLLELNMDLASALEKAESTISSLQEVLAMKSWSPACTIEAFLETVDAPNLLKTEIAKTDEVDSGEMASLHSGQDCPVSGQCTHGVPALDGLSRGSSEKEEAIRSHEVLECGDATALLRAREQGKGSMCLRALNSKAATLNDEDAVSAAQAGLEPVGTELEGSSVGAIKQDQLLRTDSHKFGTQRQLQCETLKPPLSQELDEENPCLQPADGSSTATGTMRQAVSDASSLHLKLGMTEELFDVMWARHLEMIHSFQRAKALVSSLRTRLEESELQRKSLSEHCSTLTEDLGAAEQQIVALMTKMHSMQLQSDDGLVELLQHSQWEEAPSPGQGHMGMPTSNTAWETSDELTVQHENSRLQHRDKGLEHRTEEPTGSCQELANNLAAAGAQISRLAVASHKVAPHGASTDLPRTFLLDPTSVGCDVLSPSDVTQVVSSPAHLKLIQQVASPAPVSRIGSGGNASSSLQMMALERFFVDTSGVVKGRVPCPDQETTTKASSPVQEGNATDADPSRSQMADDELDALKLLFDHHFGVVTRYLHQQMDAEVGLATSISETDSLRAEDSKLLDWQIAPSNPAGCNSDLTSANDVGHAHAGNTELEANLGDVSALNADSVFDDASMAKLLQLGLQARSLADTLMRSVEAVSAMVSSVESIEAGHQYKNSPVATCPPGKLRAF